MRILPQKHVFLFLSLLATSLAAESPKLPGPLSGAVRLRGADMRLFEDASGTMSIQEILRGNVSASFQSSDKFTPYFGFTHSAIWVQLNLQTSGPDPLWFLEVEEPLLHEVELYGPIPDQTQAGAAPVSRASAGRLLPFGERQVQHRKILFPIALSHNPQTYLLRIKSKDNVTVPIKIWPQAEFFMAELKDQIRQGIFYGIIIALILYNLFLLLSLKDINYLYYILYVAGFAVLQSSIDGSFFQMFPQAPAWLKWRVPMYSGMTAGVFVILFSRNFLRIDEAPWFIRHFHVLILGGMALLFTMSLFDSAMPTASRYVNTISALMTLYAIVCAIYRTAKGYLPARYFLAGWFMLLSGLLGASLVNLGFLPPNPVTKYMTRLGFMAELLLFSFALADRITLLRREKEEADEKALMAQKNAASQLERLVGERTKQLSVANATKDKFFSIIAHDLRGPIGTLSVLFTDAVGDDGRIDTPLLKSIRETTKQSYHLLEDLLTWAQSQRGEIAFNPTVFDAAGAVQNAVSLMRAQAVDKNIIVHFPACPEQNVKADRPMTALIVRNLLSNAIKFTPRNGTITLDVQARGEFVEISVADTGVGVPADRLDSLFQIDAKRASTPGTELESGSGLGLILCREFVLKNHGDIAAESRPGSGSRFYFTLPKAPAAGTTLLSGGMG